jgi:hypothetical protein
MLFWRAGVTKMAHTPSSKLHQNPIHFRRHLAVTATCQRRVPPFRTAHGSGAFEVALGNTDEPSEWACSAPGNPSTHEAPKHKVQGINGLAKYKI